MSDVSITVGSPGGGNNLLPSSRTGSPATTPISFQLTKEQQAQAAADALAAREGNVVKVWIRYRMCSRDRVERHYAFLIAMLITASLLFAALKPEGTHNIQVVRPHRGQRGAANM